MTIGQAIFAFSSLLSASVPLFCLDHLDLHLPPRHHGLAAGQFPVPIISLDLLITFTLLIFLITMVLQQGRRGTVSTVGFL